MPNAIMEAFRQRESKSKGNPKLMSVWGRFIYSFIHSEDMTENNQGRQTKVFIFIVLYVVAFNTCDHENRE